MQRVQVAVGVIVDEDDRVLLTRRAKGTHLAGLWEFPGGKVEPEEEVIAALQRELHEELGIYVEKFAPLIRIQHDYPAKSVSLEVYRILEYQGEPLGQEQQPLAWTPLGAIGQYRLPPADKPIVTALSLPKKYLITQADWTDPDDLGRRFELALAGGERLLQLRLKGVDAEQKRQLARLAQQKCQQYGAQLMINGDWQLVQAIGAAGVQLRSNQLEALKSRPLAEGFWVAASCHDAKQLHKAQQIGADFALLSPVKETKSHPGVPGLGWSKFSTWVDSCNLPVFALGGMGVDDLDDAINAGGQGVAGIRDLWPTQ